VRDIRRITWYPYLEPDRDSNMHLTLTYDGPLWGTTQRDNRVDHKHAIRRKFHPQLRRFWQTHARLSTARNTSIGIVMGSGQDTAAPYLWEDLACQYERAGYNFVPLVREESNLMCSVKILMLRPDPPGRLVTSGDIDNRLKTLFDSLRMPDTLDEVRGGPAEDEKPFYVLLQDDKLITHLSVETDTLLERVGAEWDKNDVRLVISVDLRVTQGMMLFDA
jgi:hypothetical protein